MNNKSRLEKAEEMLNIITPIRRVVESADAILKKIILEEYEAQGIVCDGRNDPDNKRNSGWSNLKTWKQLSDTINKSLYDISSSDPYQVYQILNQMLADTAEIINTQDEPDIPDKNCSDCPNVEICRLILENPDFVEDVKKLNQIIETFYQNK